MFGQVIAHDRWIASDLVVDFEGNFAAFTDVEELRLQQDVTASQKKVILHIIQLKLEEDRYVALRQVVGRVIGLGHPFGVEHGRDNRSTTNALVSQDGNMN